MTVRGAGRWITVRQPFVYLLPVWLLITVQVGARDAARGVCWPGNYRPKLPGLRNGRATFIGII